MKLRKLTTADEFLKLDNLINDKDVNKAIEEEAFDRSKLYTMSKKRVEEIRKEIIDLRKNK